MQKMLGIKMRKPNKFVPGYLGGWTQEERLFFISLFRQIDTKKMDDQQKRMIRRLIARLMGLSLNRYPLHIPKDCKHCGREIQIMIERHEAMCKAKQDAIKRLPPIDPAILEMIR